MKKYISITFIFSIFIFMISCTTSPGLPDINFRQAMRDFIIDLSDYAKGINSNFIIIPQNGQELITHNGEGDGIPNAEYIAAIDATGRESMFYGYYNDDQITPDEDRDHLLALCQVCEAHSIEVLATDYCFDRTKMDNSYQINFDNNFISFAANHRDLDNIPAYPTYPFPHTADADSNYNVDILADAQNFLYIINPEGMGSKTNFLSNVDDTYFDIIIMDAFYDGFEYEPVDISNLQTKPNGKTRLIIAYMSIGEAEDYRYYWDYSWRTGNPAWLDKENPNWAGNYVVRYWEQDWQNIIFGNDSSYLKKIIDAGFDGVYLDIIDGFENFE